MAQIKHQIVIEAPAAKVFPFISTGGGFKQWWAADVTETEAAVSKGTTDVVKLTLVELGFSNATPCTACSARAQSSYAKLNGAARPARSGMARRMVFDLKEDKGKTTVRFTHADWKAEKGYFVSCNTTWGELMFRLKAAAEGKAPGPLFSADGIAY